MIQKKIVRDDLLYHMVHGLCRVNQVTKESQSGREVLSYSLVPKMPTRMKVRFVISAVDMEASGFHSPVSPKKANEILEYLKAGNSTAVAEEDQTWNLAKTIFSSSHDSPEIKDTKKRQILERSAKGLVGELAFALKMTMKETATKVQKSLGDASKISPMVLSALAHAGED